MKSLLTLPISLLTGLINLHLEFDWKFSLSSFKVTNENIRNKYILKNMTHFELIYYGAI